MQKYDLPGLSIDEITKNLPDHVMKDQFCNKLIMRRLEKRKVIKNALIFLYMYNQ